MVFIGSSLVLMLIAASPAISFIASFPSGGEGFSEFWVLNPNHIVRDYPFNVQVNESHSVLVGVGNHMGFSSYFLVYVKFRNQTEPLPNATISEPSPLPSLYEYRAFVMDGGIWETSLTFSVAEASRYNDSMFVNRLSVNEAVFVVNSWAKWDSEHKGFYYQLFLELWWYDVKDQNLLFTNRFVGIWLNVTD